MDELDSPGLGLTFAIETGGAFAEMLRFQQMFDEKTAGIIGKIADMEKATGGMMQLSVPTANVTTFANASTRALQDVAVYKAKTEKAGESLIRQLDRESAAFGRTRDEMRSARVEQVAAAASAQGNSDLAQRLLASEAALYDKKFAAARAASAAAAALAEEEAADTARVAAALEQEAQARRSATLAYGMFEAAARNGMATYREEVAVQAAAAQETDRLATAAARLRASIDPAVAAQQRFDREIGQARTLISAGAISLDEYAAKLRQEQAILDETSDAHLRAGAAFGKSSFAVKEFAIQLPDIVQGLLTGQRPMTVFLQQGGQVAQIAMMAKGGVKGFTSELLGMAARIPAAAVGLGLLAGAVVAGTAAWYSYTDAVDKAQALSMGAGRVIGLSADELQKQAAAATNLANIGISSAREMVTAYVEMGGIGKDVLGGLTALTVDFAAATGKDSKGALDELGRAFQDPTKGADDLAQRYGVLTQAQVEHIKDLVEQNNLYGAQQALLSALGPAFEGAAEHANALARAGRAIAAGWQSAWEWIGKAIDRAAGGGTLAQQIGDLQRERAAGPTVGQYLTGGGQSFYDNIDKQISALQVKARQAEDFAKNAQARSRGVKGMSIVDGIVGEDDVGNLRTRLGAVNSLLADNGRAAGLTAAQVTRARQAQDMLTHAVGSYLPEAEKQVRVAQIDAQIAVAKKAHDQARVQSLTVQKSELESSGKLMTAAQAEALAVANGSKAKTEAAKTGDKHAATLAREAAAMTVSADAAIAAASAYLTSSTAGATAEARRKALTDATKKGIDVDAQVARQMTLAAAETTLSGAKTVAQMNDEATARDVVMGAVRDGTVAVNDMDEALKLESALRPLLAARAYLHGDALKALNDVIASTPGAFAKAQAAAEKFDLTKSMQSGDDELARLREELRLVGVIDEVRTRSLAEFKAQQDVNKMPGVDPAQAAAYVKQQGDIAAGQAHIAAATRDLNDQLSFSADKWDLVARNVERAAQGMADAFGTAGKAIGDLASVYTNFNADQARADQAHRTALQAAGSEAARDRVDAKYRLQNSTAQVALYGDMASAAKSFFATGSAGYETLQKAEQVFRAVQFAMSVKAIAQDAIETGSSIAKSAARTASNAVEAVTKAIASLPFPLNIAAGAATIAALAAIGVAIAGGFGGHAGTIEKPNDGTGTVLGDSAAKSDSIKNAIDAVKQVDLLTNTYSREMAASLKSIDNQIGSFAAQIVKGGDINATDGIATGFKTSGLGSLFGALGLGFLSSLFGTRTDVTGSGLYGAPQTVGQINAGGYAGQSYSDIEKTHKFLGIVTGRSYSTAYGSLDPSLNNQFTLILKSFDQAIAAAAGPLGDATDAVQAKLNSFVVNIGKIDLQGLSGADIQSKLENIFGALGDQMATYVYPEIAQFQKVGEGALETLVRVASTVESVTTSLDELGSSASNLGLTAKLGLADQFDSLSDLSSAVDAYFQAFYTPAEQAAAKTAQLAKVFDSLGLSLPSTIAGYRQLVDAQDLNTTAGQAAYATLLQLAPAFADLQSAMEGAKSAADILSERQDLQRQLLELQGDTAAIRALDLAKVDVSNRMLQQQVWALSDAQDAAKNAQDLADAWKSVGDTIEQEIARIQGLSDTGGSASFATLLGQFNAANTAARGGDQDAAKSLPGLSQSLLTAAEKVATSQQELSRIQAQTAAQLQLTDTAIKTFSTVAATPLVPVRTISDTMTAAAVSQQAVTPAAANDEQTASAELKAEIVQLRTDLTSALAAIASSTGSMKRTLDNVTLENGGNAITVASAA